MVDRAELRRLAEAATPGVWVAGWRQWPEQIGCCPLIGRPYSIHLESTHNNLAAASSIQDAAFIAAASPDVVLGLLDEIDAQEQVAIATEEIAHRLGEERDQLRAVAVMLKGALEMLDRKLSSLNHGTSSVVRQVVYVALADPEVEKL